MIIGIAEPNVTLPVTDNACKTPTDAELDWIIAVRTAPASTPKMGFVKRMNNSANSGTSLRPSTALDIVSIPNISVAKPKRIVPVSFFASLFENMVSIIPISASTGVKEVGFKS